jgi:hypothetical protein
MKVNSICADDQMKRKGKSDFCANTEVNVRLLRRTPSNAFNATPYAKSQRAANAYINQNHLPNSQGITENLLL